MFNMDDLYFVNLIFIVLILFINTILSVYILNRLRKLEAKVTVDELLLDKLLLDKYDDEDEDYVNGEIKEYEDDEDDYIN